MAAADYKAEKQANKDSDGTIEQDEMIESLKEGLQAL
jgi:hypothetical protein